MNTPENKRHIYNISHKVGKYIFLQDKKQKMLNCSSNDYLNLSTNKELLTEFLHNAQNDPEFLFSSTSSRLLSGNSTVYTKLENHLSLLFQKEACLLFNTGYQCNLGIISALMGKDDVIFSDKLNHNSIVAGMKLSDAKCYRYKHCDYEHLENLLQKNRLTFNKALIISESLFSMDGDMADIAKLIALKKKYKTMFMLDEAHAFGVFGDNLCGLASEKASDNFNSQADNLDSAISEKSKDNFNSQADNIYIATTEESKAKKNNTQINSPQTSTYYANDIDIICATFGKSLASSGAFCVASKDIVDILINKASSFIFSTALAPAQVMWTLFLLQQKQSLLQKQSKKLRHLLQSLDYSSQIIPIMIGKSADAVRIAKKLQEKGYFALPIRPPTVPHNMARIRISLGADMEKDEIVELLQHISALQ